MSNLVEHAKKELEFAGLLDTDDEMQQAMNKHIIHMVTEFSKEGHSGFSANYAISALTKLLRFEPLAPLTGEEHEWAEDFDGKGTQQNKRMGNIMRDKKGQAYRIDGLIFRDQCGCTFTCGKSFTPVEFPYSPEEPQIVDIYERDAKE